MDAQAPRPQTKRCLIARMDYGYHALEAPGWAEADLSRAALDEALQLPLGAPGLLLRRAEYALAWAGTREGEGLWPRLAQIAARRGLALECRFPRHARELAAHLEAEDCEPVLWETPADGGPPPLYEGLAPDAARLHLTHEWETALGAARGGAALLRLALLLARGGPQAPPALADQLGLTAGATRAYLSWMEDVALVRRDGRAYDLRHPLLCQLFAPGASPGPAPRPAPPRPRPTPPHPRPTPQAPPTEADRAREPAPEAPATHRPSSVDWD